MSARTLETYRTPRGALLGIHNAKTPRGEKLGYLTAIMYLAPHTLAGQAIVAPNIPTVCPMSTPDCRADCLYTSGRGALPTTKDARVNRTLRYWNDRGAFMRDLSLEITQLEALAAQHGLRLAVRLNGTSDILWERMFAPVAIQRAKNNLMDQFPNVRFYDYTKHKPAKRAHLPANYRLTFSAQRETLRDAMTALAMGWNVSAVVSDADHAALMALAHPALFDATETDARFLDVPATIGLLKAKGTLRKKNAFQSAMILTPGEVLTLADWGPQCTSEQRSTPAKNARRSKSAPTGGGHVAP